MVNTLIETFFTVPMFRNVTLQCLTEIGKCKIEVKEENKVNGSFVFLSF